jgi:hypothetical protein
VDLTRPIGIAFAAGLALIILADGVLRNLGWVTVELVILVLVLVRVAASSPPSPPHAEPDSAGEREPRRPAPALDADGLALPLRR